MAASNSDTNISKPTSYIFEEISCCNTPAFDEFYELFVEMFPDEGERETPEGFVQIAQLNQPSDIQTRLGPWREILSVVRRGPAGPLVGGHVFGVTTSSAHRRFGYSVSVQGIYTFLSSGARGHLSFLRELKTYTLSRALDAYGFDREAAPALIFLEVNNPEKMTAKQIAEDTARSGYNPAKRFSAYKLAGFRSLQFCYVQPPLRADAQPIRYLDLMCYADGKAALPADVVVAHLRAFFAISVFKGDEASFKKAMAEIETTLQPGVLVNFA